MADSVRALRFGWWALAVGYATHCVAHVFMWGETPVGVRAGGTLAVVLVVVVRVMIDRGNAASGLALAVLGAALAAGLLLVHLPGYWGPFSQPWRGQVNLACWATLGAAVAGGIAASVVAGRRVLVDQR